MCDILRVAVYALAVWRITAYLCYEKSGQWVRDRAGMFAVDLSGNPITFWGRVLSCFWCTSTYVAIALLPIVLSDLWWVVLPEAASGVAILLNHSTRIFRLMED